MINCFPAPTTINTKINNAANTTKTVAMNASHVGAPLLLRAYITGEIVKTMINAVIKALIKEAALWKNITTTPRLARPTRKSKEEEILEFDFISEI